MLNLPPDLIEPIVREQIKDRERDLLSALQTERPAGRWTYRLGGWLIRLGSRLQRRQIAHDFAGEIAWPDR